MLTIMNTRLELPQFLIDRGLTGEGAEIGVLFGEFSRHILSNWPGTLYMIDPWEQQPADRYLDGCNSVDMNKALAKAVAAVAEFGARAVILREYSVPAAQHFRDRQLSWAYLDGNHSFDVITADLNAYWPKIRSGGILAGHDFYERHTPFHDCGVEIAVREFAMQNNLKLNVIPDAEGEPGWWFDKP